MLRRGDGKNPLAQTVPRSSSTTEQMALKRSNSISIASSLKNKIKKMIPGRNDDERSTNSRKVKRMKTKKVGGKDKEASVDSRRSGQSLATVGQMLAARRGTN